jgi:hypothetical protein
MSECGAGSSGKSTVICILVIAHLSAAQATANLQTPNPTPTPDH